MLGPAASSRELFFVERWFGNGGAEEVYLGSADLMPRNLDRRVEVLFPVADPALLRQLRDEVLETYLRDNVLARRMSADGTYRRLVPVPGETPIDSQSRLMAARPPASARVKRRSAST
jgi:polyphosphate kinase